MSDHDLRATQATTKPSKEIVIFVYHRFGDPRHLSTNISLNIFENHLKYLKDNGFTILTLSDALDKKIEDGERLAVITIDDAFSSFYENAIPVLKKMQVPATLFVNTKTVGAEDYMSWDQLREVRKQGIEIGNHSHSHAYFLNAGENYLDVFRQDVDSARMLFKENLRVQPALYAYPYGEFTIEMEQVIREMGFRAGIAQFSGVWYEGGNDYEIPRFPMNNTYGSMESFKEKAQAQAFHVKMNLPGNHIIAKGDKPVWKLMLEEEPSRGRLQCFVQGSFCQSTVSSDTLLITSEESLTQRRTLYTITMPDDNGRWFWLSRLWIAPDVGE